MSKKTTFLISHQCDERFMPIGEWHTRRCRNRAVANVQDKWLCAVHFRAVFKHGRIL